MFVVTHECCKKEQFVNVTHPIEQLNIQMSRKSYKEMKAGIKIERKNVRCIGLQMTWPLKEEIKY